jgi:hypothetical protein
MALFVAAAFRYIAEKQSLMHNFFYTVLRPAGFYNRFTQALEIKD